MDLVDKIFSFLCWKLELHDSFNKSFYIVFILSILVFLVISKIVTLLKASINIGFLNQQITNINSFYCNIKLLRCLNFFISVMDSWTAVATWRWVANDDNCGICRMPFDGCCPDCKLPGDDCPLGKVYKKLK